MVNIQKCKEIFKYKTQDGWCLKRIAQKYSISVKEVTHCLDFLDGLFDVTTCLGVYNRAEGLGGMAKTSRLRMAKEYGVSRHKIERAYYYGMGESTRNAEVQERKKKESQNGIEQITDLEELDYSNLDPEFITDVQEFANRVTIEETCAEFGLAPEKVEKILKLKVEEHSNDVFSISKEEHLIQSLVPGTKVENHGKLKNISLDDGYATFENDQGKISSVTFDGSPIYVKVIGADYMYAEKARIAARAETCGLLYFEGDEVTLLSSSDAWKTGLIMTNVGPIPFDDDRLLKEENTRNNNKIFEDFRKREIAYNATEKGHFDQRVIKPTNDDPKYRVFVTSVMASIVNIETGEQICIQNNHDSFIEICGLISEGNIKEAISVYKSENVISSYEGNHYKWERGDELLTIIVDGVETQWENSGPLCKRLEQFSDSGLKHGFAIFDLFVGNAIQNPSRKTFSEIPKFMRFGDLQINEQGYLVCYKAVNDRYYDDYTNTINNAPGSVIRMKRILIDENSHVTCSAGLHVCSLDYVNQMAGYSRSNSKIVRVLLNPRDIVAIPSDHQQRKIRCCQYSVLDCVTREYQRGELRSDLLGLFHLGDS